jgi:DNA replication protein DnaC
VFCDIVQHVVGRWHEVVGDLTIGDAIIDRVVHRAHRLELKGASMRKKQTVSAPNLTDATAG